MDFSEMTGPQLVEAYNRMMVALGGRQITKFESRIIGIERCQKLAKSVTVSAPEPDTAREEIKSIAEVLAPKPSLDGSSRSRKASKVIRILSKGNPRRKGTDAYRFFEAMIGSPTVGEYLAKFPEGEQKKAAQWLWNTCRDGHTELLG